MLVNLFSIYQCSQFLLDFFPGIPGILKHWRCHKINKLACYSSGPYEKDINMHSVYDCWTGSCQPRASCFVPASDKYPFVAVYWKKSVSQHYLLQTEAERGGFREAISAIERN